MITIAVATLKGGNAKTTTCVAIAAVIAELGHSVALVDADPQSTATMILGLKPVAEPWSAEPVELYIKQLRTGSITLVRGGRPLRLASPQQRGDFFDRPDLRSDFTIIDTAPGEIELVDVALRRSDLLLIPVEPSPLSLTGMTDAAGLAARCDRPPLIRTILTRVHRIRVSTRDLAERVERLLPDTLCRTIIPEDARAVDSPDFGLPVTLSHRTCRVSDAYRALVAELYPSLAEGRNGAIQAQIPAHVG
jgi:chromosome partitioning protein